MTTVTRVKLVNFNKSILSNSLRYGGTGQRKQKTMQKNELEKMGRNISVLIVLGEWNKPSQVTVNRESILRLRNIAHKGKLPPSVNR